MEPVDVSLIVAVGAIVGAVAPFAPFASALFAAAIVAGCLLAPRGRVRVGALVVASSAALVTGVRAVSLVAADGRAYERAREVVATPTTCAFEGVVSSMPVDRGGVRAEVTIDALGCADRPVASLPTPMRARLHALPDDVARGDRIEGIARLALAPRVANADLGDPRPSAARNRVVASGALLALSSHARAHGLGAMLDHARAALRAGLAHAVPIDARPLARALVLGEEDLDPDDDDAFRRSGLTHLLAVSGSHVALVVLGGVALLRRALLRVTSLATRVDVARIASAVGVAGALVYEQLAGDAGSARRASATAVVLLVVRAAGRRPDPARALGLAVLVALALDPLAPFDLSFSLSLAATVGLVALAAPLDRRVAAWAPKIPCALRVPITTTIGATVACAPLVATLSGSLPTLGVPANVIALPIGELAALPLANLAALAGAIDGGGLLSRTCGAAAGGALRVLRVVARTAAGPAWGAATVPPPTSVELAIVAGAAAAAYLSSARGRRLVAIGLVAMSALLLAEVRALRVGAPRGVLRVTVLDVGQGDAALVDLPDGSLLLIDAGGEIGSPWDPGSAVVARVLAARRRRRVDAAILSHPHPDHFLGLAGALRDVEVGALWDTGQGEEEGAGPRYVALLADLRRRGIVVLRPASLCGGPRAYGGATLEVLHPCPGFDRDRAPNDNSFVVRLGFGAHHALLVGDAEHLAEAELLAHAPDRLGADFLKVGHHGSRTSSTPAFLRAVSPSVAAISCGVRNRFGHPHTSTLHALAAAGATIVRTDLDGAVTWTSDGVDWTLATARGGW